MTLRRTLVPLATAVALTVAGFTVPVSALAETNADRQIASSVARLVQAPALGSSVGVHVRDVGNGMTVASQRGGTGFIPASTMKVVTAFTSLAELGAGHRFTTTVRSTGSGRILLQGGGDPILTRAQVGVLAKRTKKVLKRRGLLSTPIVVDFDDDLFGMPSNAPGWESGDMPAYISAVRGLTILGTYSTDTGRVAAQVFVDALRSRGVNATLGSRIDFTGGAPRLARFRGNDVGEAVAAMLPPSENNVAEILFRQVALATKRPATWTGAKRAARAVLRAEGIDTDGSTLVDGSGLSYSNRVTGSLLTEVLAAIDTDPRFVEAREALPIAGVNGTLIRRFVAAPASCARGAVAAKTGSLPMTVSTLAGLTTGSDGRRKAFAILVNNRPSSQAWSSTSLAIDTIAAAVHGCTR